MRQSLFLLGSIPEEYVLRSPQPCRTSKLVKTSPIEVGGWYSGEPGWQCELGAGRMVTMKDIMRSTPHMVTVSKNRAKACTAKMVGCLWITNGLNPYTSALISTPKVINSLTVFAHWPKVGSRRNPKSLRCGRGSCNIYTALRMKLWIS